MAILSNEQLKQAITSWMNDPTRDLVNDLPANIVTAAEKHYLRMFFNAADAADQAIAAAQERKQTILDLKAQYPNVEP